MPSLAQDVEEEPEAWRQQGSTATSAVYLRPYLVPVVQAALRQLVPPDHQGECARMRQAIVLSVETVVNTQLWKQYCLKRQQITEVLQVRQDWHSAMTLSPGIVELSKSFPQMRLVPGANEVMLLHGTGEENAMHIARQGFDERLTQRRLYGRGVYFTIDACKAAQYAGDGGCLIMARVLLGHPFLAEATMPECERPPEVAGHGVPHDSVVAMPGILRSGPRGRGRSTALAGKAATQGATRQTHWEFVVPRGDLQIYPELIIRLKVPQLG